MKNILKKGLFCLFTFATLVTLNTLNGKVTEKEKAAKDAYENLLRIRITTPKKLRLQNLEQLLALLLIDALDDIYDTIGQRVEKSVVNVKNQLQKIYKTNEELPQHVYLARQWIIGKIGNDIIDNEKFAAVKEQPLYDGQTKLDRDLNLLKKDFTRIVKTIEKDLKKEISLPFIDDIKVLYGPIEDCPVCLEEKPLIQFSDDCLKPHICIKCKRELLKQSKTKCPVCGESI